MARVRVIRTYFIHLVLCFLKLYICDMFSCVTHWLNNFQLSVEINSRLHWFLTAICDWSRRPASPLQPIRCRTKFNWELLATVILYLTRQLNLPFFFLRLVWLWQLIAHFRITFGPFFFSKRVLVLVLSHYYKFSITYKLN